MSALRELYQEVIIDHGRRPRNFLVMDSARYIKEGFNPLCGDKVTLYLNEENDVIQQLSFQGSGCAISMASASLMTEALQGKSLAQVKELFENFHDVMLKKTASNPDNLGKLAALSGVAEFPARVKCATLAWHTLMSILKERN